MFSVVSMSLRAVNSWLEQGKGDRNSTIDLRGFASNLSYADSVLRTCSSGRGGDSPAEPELFLLMSP